MGVQLSRGPLLEALTERAPSIATICSHSSLQIFHGARLEGYRTVGLTVKEPPRFYQAFPLAKPDRFLILPSLTAIDEVVPELRKENAILIPTGSFVEYVGSERFGKLPVPVFGNRKVMEWESDREKEREWLDMAHVPMPRKYRDASEVDGPVIVKYYGAKGGKGFILAKNADDLLKFPIRQPHVIQEYIIGTRYYLHFFYSPLTQDGYRVGNGSLELLGIDRRDEANIDELYKLGSQEELTRTGLRPSFVVTGNVGVVLRESLLPQVFEVAERIVKTSIDLFGGMVGPFCVEGIMTEELEFKVFEISTRIVAGTNLYVSGSPYSDMVAPGLSSGRRIALEIRRGSKEGRLAEIIS